ncbi:hypothetical protein Dxin01_00529 [Deinococcus xinjiangensis]|uniref:MarR family transcriptional regulator n=1 Tax=Deinococcus xinjiangensis TaxID=457454 RepID=A0ABP9V6C3_9DEIO
MNVARLLLSLIAGLSAALIAFSAAFVRGDVGGVMHYLHERAALRRLTESGAGAEQIAKAKADLLALGQAVAAPELATQLLPLELLLGVLVGLGVWWIFGERVARAASGARPDIQERMVLRFAHRRGGVFTLRDLMERSPLSAEQAREVTTRMLERGQLRREGEGYRL